MANQPLSTPKCSQCDSDLIQISNVTEKLEGSRFPQTTTTFRCSNKECQDEKDKQTAKRVQLQKDKASADIKRAEEKVNQKKALAEQVLGKSTT